METQKLKQSITLERIFGIILLLPPLFEWNNDNPCGPTDSIYLGMMAIAGAYLLKGSSRKQVQNKV